MGTKKLTKGLLLIMAAASGICVANIYYIQPLLGSLADFFGVSNSQQEYLQPVHSLVMHSACS